MARMSIFRRISRAIERFNRWFGPAAAGSGASSGSGSSGGPASTYNPVAIGVVLTEIEKDVRAAERPDSNT
jgi:hypothetical protein